MEPNDEVKKIIEKINNGQATDDEKQRFQHWYNSWDDTKTYIAQDGTPEQLKASIWKGIHARALPKTNVWKKWVAVAAAVVFVGTASFFFWLSTDLSDAAQRQYSGVLIMGNDQKIEKHQNSLDNFLDTAAYVDLTTLQHTESIKTLATEKGQFSKVILPDGTKVWLNVGTKLSLSDDFKTASQRTVSLSGEAYFEVTTIANRSFVVQAKDQSIRVLGTKFNVKAYPNQEQLVTSLYEGSIELVYQGQVTLLKPAEVARTGPRRVDVLPLKDTYQGKWRQLQFEFDNEQIEEVLAQIGRWYNMEIVYDSTVPKQLISGKITPGATMPDLLLILSNLTEGQYTRKGDALHVKFKNN